MTFQTASQVNVGTDSYTNLQILISKKTTPLVVVDYLTETGGYFAGDSGFDFGDQRTTGAFTLADVSPTRHITPLTANLLKTTNCDNCANTTLVTRQGACIRDTNNNCVTDSSHQDAVFIREPAAYLAANFSNLTDQGNFTNEIGPDSIPHPKEGFADIFKIHRYFQDGVAMLPEDEIRRQFIEENNRFCKWVCNLLDSFPTCS